MKVSLLAVLILVTAVGSAGAVVDFSIGPYFGMDIPIVNDMATSGSLFGIQGKAALTRSLALGAYFDSSSLGEVEGILFEDDPDQFTDTLPGGDTKSFGLAAYLGRFAAAPGFRMYFMGGVGTWKWQRDFTDDVSEIAWRFGPGAEVVLRNGLGIEARGMLQVVPLEDGGSVKSGIWFVGLNYHTGGGSR